MELSEGWRAAISDEELRRSYPAAAFDDSDWAPVSIPGQWRSNAAFADSDGPLLYRTRFEAAAEQARSWLHLDGIFYNADVWLDGSYVGDTEGYFVPHAFEVTDALLARSEHTLALEVACARPEDLTQKRNLTGLFQHSDGLDAEDNPGGIWRPVHVEHTGPVRIATLRVLSPRADAQRATLELSADLDTVNAQSVVVRTIVTQGERAVDHEAEHQLAANQNAITWRVDIDDPALWWPHALGDQNLADVAVEVIVGGAVSDTRNVTTGLRSVSMRDFRWTINGERLFLKGVNHGPTTRRLADATPEQVRRDIALAKEANLDLVRVHAHVARPELYDEADRLGVLLWQDIPLQGGYARGVRKQATRQARAAVDLLGHHPSIAVWCAHDKPPLNATILDASIKRAIEHADKTRPVVARPGAVPHIRNERDFPAWLRRVPRLAQFVSEFDSDEPAVVKHYVETLRRLKYRPAGGFAAPNPGSDALVAACEQVIVTATRPKVAYELGEPIELDVHVVSDRRVALTELRTTATITFGDGSSHQQIWVGNCDADACVRVGTINAIAPTQIGPITIELATIGESVDVSNQYVTQVVVGGTGGARMEP